MKFVSFDSDTTLVVNLWMRTARRKCGNFALQEPETQLWTSPEDTSACWHPGYETAVEMNFPNHELLLLRVIFAFPIGLEASTFFSTCVSVDEPPTVAKYHMAYFADTILPVPDSPDTMID